MLAAVVSASVILASWLTNLDRWENLPFLVAVVVGLLFMAMQILGFGLDELLGGAAGGAADAGGGAEAGGLDAGADADVDVDADADAGLDADADADGPGDLAEGPGALVSVLNWFNVGRAPFMVLFQCFLLSFGVAGVLGTSLLAAREGLRGGAALLYALPFALAAAALGTKLIGGAFARFLPTYESKALSKRCLVGLEAEVVSAVDQRSGRAVARDKDGDRYTVFCRVEAGQAPLPRGARVALLQHIAKDDVYLVGPAAAPGAGPAPGAAAGAVAPATGAGAPVASAAPPPAPARPG